MIHQFKVNLEDLVAISSETRLFIAISGGIDSMVLTELCLLNGLSPHLLHCNFKLRGKESDKDETFIKNYAVEKGLKFDTVQFNTEAIAKANGQTIQVCARTLRYNWFKDFLTSDHDYLMTAHHLDDSIETFHINMLRGTGLKGLTGVPKKRGQIIRPLYSFTKEDIEVFAKANKIDFRADSSNLSDKYLRNKIRHQIIPSLEGLTEGYALKMKTLMQETEAINGFINGFINDFKAQYFKGAKHLSVEIDDIEHLPDVILSRLFEQYGITRSSVESLRKLLSAQTGGVFHTQSFTFLKNRTELLISQRRNESIVDLNIETAPTKVKTEFGSLTIELVPNNTPLDFKPHIAFLNGDLIDFPLTLSNQYKGQKIKPLGMKGNKLISDIYIDRKLSGPDKLKQLILKHQDTCVWIVGICINDHYKIDEHTKKILKVTYSE